MEINGGQRTKMEVREWRAVYERALQLWQGKAYDQAAACLQQYWQKTGISTLPGRLLMGYVLRDSGHYVSECDCLRGILRDFHATDPKSDGQYLADTYSLLGGAQRMLGKNAEAVHMFLRAAALDCEPIGRLTEYSNAIFAANAVEGYTAADMQKLYGDYRTCLSEAMAAAGMRPYGTAVWKHDRIRVGYMSADLHRHPVASFVKSLLTGYCREKFRVYVYDTGTCHDDITEALRTGGAMWRQMKPLETLEDMQVVAETVRSDEIDVLVDLSGHTKGSALPVFAWRAAPVQISGIGYFNSTGLSETTGFLSDVYCAPQERSPYFVEPLLRLPHTHFCYAPYQEFPAPGAPPRLTRGYVTFGCFNHFAKVTDEMLGAWRRILQVLPTAKLVLKHRLFDSREGLAFTRERLERLGMPLNRVEFRGFSQDYLREYRDIDIALDTSPYQGGATTCEALFMGVPVVSLVGRCHGARFGYSLLANIGLPQLAADTPAHYVRLAVGLARDKELLCALHKELRSMMKQSPLMDCAGYMQEIEHLYAVLFARRHAAVVP